MSNLGLKIVPRLREIQSVIDSRFSSLQETTIGQARWSYNGNEDYSFGNIKAGHFIVRMIISNYPEKKSFYIMDLGSGLPIWGRAMVEYINNNLNYDDLEVHIISVTGEANDAEYPLKFNEPIGVCRIYEIGSFSIENLQSAFHDKNFAPDIKFDFIISSWALRHCVDPLATFVQLYNVLKLDGIMFFDGFFLCINDPINTDNIQHLEQILFNLRHNVRYIRIYDVICGRENAYIIKKISLSPLFLALKYRGLLELNIKCARLSSSGYITLVETLPGWVTIDKTKELEISYDIERLPSVGGVEQQNYCVSKEGGIDLLKELYISMTYYIEAGKNMERSFIRSFRLLRKLNKPTASEDDANPYEDKEFNIFYRSVLQRRLMSGSMLFRQRLKEELFLDEPSSYVKLRLSC